VEEAFIGPVILSLFAVAVARLTHLLLSLSFFGGRPGGGGGSLPRAAGGPHEVAADGELERTVYNIAMIQ